MTAKRKVSWPPSGTYCLLDVCECLVFVGRSCAGGTLSFADDGYGNVTCEAPSKVGQRFGRCSRSAGTVSCLGQEQTEASIWAGIELGHGQG